MRHTVVYRRDDRYSAFPQLAHLPDGRLAVGLWASRFRDHWGLGEWVALVSDDEGETWKETGDPEIPHNWPGDTAREKSDRFTAELPDGTYLCAGMVGWSDWPEDRRAEAERQGLTVHSHPNKTKAIAVRENRLFVQHSTDRGRTWARREWVAPGFKELISFSRGVRLSDGAVLVPVYGTDDSGTPCDLVWYSPDGVSGWRLLPTGAHGAGVRAGETAYVEVAPRRVLAHSRNAMGRFTEMWSDDGGRTWSYPLLTDIWAPHSPPHLLKLRDGRVLCTYGYRRQPMGVRAVLSRDGGETWDTDNTVVLRDDGGTPTQLDVPEDVDLEELRLSGAAFQAEVQRVLSRAKYPTQRARADNGYPISTQLPDDSIFTVYYITPSDGVTHAAGTRWEA